MDDPTATHADLDTLEAHLDDDITRNRAEACKASGNATAFVVDDDLQSASSEFMRGYNLCRMAMGALRTKRLIDRVRRQARPADDGDPT